MALVHETLNLLLLLAFSTCSFSSISTNSQASKPVASKAKPQRLTAKLIHHRSIFHPHYNPNDTTKDQIDHDIQRSRMRTRLAYLQARANGSLASDDYRTHLYPSFRSFSMLANISIGQPPIPQLVVIDTASNYFWILCHPCLECYKYRVNLVFDPSKSSTFTPICKTPCRSNRCKCSIEDQRTFIVKYVENTSAIGTLGHDTVSFETSDEGMTQVSNIEFGCGYGIKYFTDDPGYNGILGLNNAPNSLASQIGKKFSYCIGSLSDKSYNYNQLVLGEGADLEGDSTSFEIFHDMYYITMEGISIGEKRLAIPPDVFELKMNGEGGVIIDSGATQSYIVNDVYDILKEEVRNLIGKSLKEDRNKNDPRLCYKGSLNRDLVGFPVVTFHFAGGAELALDTRSFFDQRSVGTFCMAINPSPEAEPSTIGLLAQQSYNVGFDLDEQLIYFQRIDCELLSG